SWPIRRAPARSVVPRPKQRTNRPPDDLRRLFGHSTTEPANEPALRRPPAPVRSPHDRSGERTGLPTTSGACSVTPRPKRRTNRPSDDLRRLFGHSTTEPRTDAKRRGLARRLGAIR